jgi:ATP-dependent DNA helicase PIF1
MDNIEVNAEQEYVIRRVLDKKSVFYTGSAGTGKTFLLNKIIEELRGVYGAKFAEKVAVTAMTGIAATHVDGTTINYALGLGQVSSYGGMKSMMSRKQSRDKIRNYEVMIIDEVGMLSAEMFEFVEALLRNVRGDGRPAGGLQLILCGDFFQLPPVFKRPYSAPQKDEFLNFGFAFQAPAWSACFPPESVVRLSQIYRQSDEEFAFELNCIRTGEDAHGAIRRLRAECSRPIEMADGIKATRLFAKNVDVDRLNLVELDELPGEACVFSASDIFKPNKTQKEVLKTDTSSNFKQFSAAEKLALKRGAQVMLIKNLDPLNGLANGSRGVVVDFVDKYSAMMRSSDEDQFAIIREFKGDRVPLVRFMNGQTLPILPVAFVKEVNDVGVYRRVQLPLKLAWTMTIHKSQGLTLDAVQVSLAGMFAHGQVYVALSRARSKQGLQMVDCENFVLNVDPEVKAFYDTYSALLTDPPDENATPWAKYCKWRWNSDKPLSGSEILAMCFALK